MNNFFKKGFALVFLFAFIAGRSLGQPDAPPKELYVATGIPDSLKENANSVLRYSWLEYDVSGPGKEETKVHEIIAILNEKGDSFAGISLPYNKKFISVGSFEMKIYDADGKQLKKYKKSDMYDRAAEDDESIITDDRVLEIGHTISSYPTTVEIEFELDRTSLMGLGDWRIQLPEQSVQNSYCAVNIPLDMNVRYLNENIKLAPVISRQGNDANYFWQIHNVKAITPEVNAMDWRVLPSVSFVANNFVYYGQPGDMSSWQAFGKWLRDLKADVCSLTPEREAEIRKMTDTIKTDKAKARFLYNYMQQNMRYVSIQLGIGGLKPFPATFVDEKKYGDCKALSNYMSALLKAVGIKSYYAVINSGNNEEPVPVGFPENSFDHVILCVPFKGDTTWLECTRNTQPFGLLGPFTENRNALIITEDGGKLVSTPRSKMEDNVFNSEVDIKLDAHGGAKADIKIMSTGEYRADYIEQAGLKLERQKEIFMRELNIKQPISFDIIQGKDERGVKEIDLALDYDKFSDINAGDKLFYRPHAFDLVAFTVPVTEHRKSDFYFDHPLEKHCITTIELPPGFEVETLPANQSLKFSYGDYDVKYSYDAAKNQVISTAKFNITNQDIPAAKYNELQGYLDAVAKAQNKKLVIKKKA